MESRKFERVDPRILTANESHVRDKFRVLLLSIVINHLARVDKKKKKNFEK